VYSEQTGVGGLQAGIETYSDDRGDSKPVGSYSGKQNWSMYLQAPDIYYQILERNQNKLTTIGSVADVFRGTRTGKNSYFYPDEETIEKFNLPSDALHPTVKSPRPLTRPLVTRNDLDTQVILIPEEPDDESLKQYIEFGKEEGYDTGTTAGDPWYSLTDVVRKTRIFWQESHYTKHAAYYSEEPFYLDQQLYGIDPHDTEDLDEKLLAAILNSSFYALVTVLYGREMSGRSVKTTSTEIANFPIPDPQKLNDKDKEQMRDAFDDLMTEEMTAVYDEFDDPERQHLDQTLFDILDLSNDGREQVYKNIKDLIKQIRKRDQQR
jgi:hypothetical protein